MLAIRTYNTFANTTYKLNEIFKASNIHLNVQLCIFQCMGGMVITVA